MFLLLMSHIWTLNFIAPFYGAHDMTWHTHSTLVCSIIIVMALWMWSWMKVIRFFSDYQVFLCIWLIHISTVPAFLPLFLNLFMRRGLASILSMCTFFGKSERWVILWMSYICRQGWWGAVCNCIKWLATGQIFILICKRKIKWNWVLLLTNIPLFQWRDSVKWFIKLALIGHFAVLG